MPIPLMTTASLRPEVLHLDISSTARIRIPRDRRRLRRLALASQPPTQRIEGELAASLEADAAYSLLIIRRGRWCVL